MTSDVRTWVLDQRAMRPVVATLVTIVAFVAFASRSDQVVSWSMLGPIVVAYWAWGLGGRRSGYIHLFGLVLPLVLEIIESDNEVSMFITILTVAAVAAWTRNRRYVRIVIGLTMFMTGLLGVVQAINDFAWPNWLFGMAFAWGCGEIIWRFTGTVDELEHTRSLVADQAALQERRRIARDVHDLVGHSLSVVMMHVSGARLLVHKDPDEAERALVQAEDAARQSLAEIRRTVGLLRDESDPTTPAVPSAELTDVPTLVHDLNAAGQPVTLSLTGPIEQLDPATSLAGYRIVQEALTNANRHTIDATIDVVISMNNDSCDIEVTNQGGQAIDLGRGSGFGLVSMRERAKSVGGSLVAGPTADGWTVDASLPVETIGTRRR